MADVIDIPTLLRMLASPMVCNRCGAPQPKATPEAHTCEGNRVWIKAYRCPKCQGDDHGKSGR